MADEKLHTSNRVVQQMSRQGLIEENITQNTVQNISQRQGDFLINGGQAEQAYDQGQNRTYYENNLFTDAPDNLQTIQDLTIQIQEEIVVDIQSQTDEEFAGLKDRKFTVSSEHGSYGEETVEENSLDDKKQKKRFAEDKEPIAKEVKEKDTPHNYLRFNNDEEDEDVEEIPKKEVSDDETEKKSKLSEKAKKRLRENEDSTLKFEEDETEERVLEKKKEVRRLIYKKAEMQQNVEQEQSECGEERLRFEADTDIDYPKSELKRFAKTGYRIAKQEMSSHQEEKLDFGAENAYQLGKGVERAGRVAARLLTGGKGGGDSRFGNAKRFHVSNSSYPNLKNDNPEEQNKFMYSRTSRLKSGSKYFQSAENTDYKKEYQKKINQRRSMELIQEQGQTSQKNAEFIAVVKKALAHKKNLAKTVIAVVVGAAALILTLVILLFAAVYYLAQIITMGSGAAYGGLYQSTYSDITDCEAYYRELETDLEERIAHIEEEYPGYYEYIYDLGNIGHNAVDLISYLSSKYKDMTIDRCIDELNSLFSEMYTLTVEIKEEERERIKTDALGNEMYDAEGNFIKEKFMAQICYITLVVKPWDDMMLGRLTKEEQEQYSVFLISQGAQQVLANPLVENWRNKISSPFGYRIHPITKEKTMHNGIDIAVPVGTPLYSASAGTVKIAQYSETAGNYIKVLMDNGYSVTYMHLDSLGVSPGDIVNKGTPLGTTGNTGRSTGPHLHLEVRTSDNKAIDPTFIVANE